MKCWLVNMKIPYPSSATQKLPGRKWMKRQTLMKLNAYMAEMNYWCHADPDYIAFTHNNLNALWTAKKVWTCNGKKDVIYLFMKLQVECL